MSKYDRYRRYAMMLATLVRLRLMSKGELREFQYKGLLDGVIPK